MARSKKSARMMAWHWHARSGRLVRAARSGRVDARHISSTAPDREPQEHGSDE